MASSSSNQYVTLEIGDESYPYPSNLSAASFISVKLSGTDDYSMWKTQMLCLLKSHGMYGFIDGTLVSPQMSASGKEKGSSGQSHDQTHWLWTRSDTLVKGWILGSLSTETLRYVLKRLSEKFHQETNIADDDYSAKELWDELKTLYAHVRSKSWDEIDTPYDRDGLSELLFKGTIYLLFAGLPFIWNIDILRDGAIVKYHHRVYGATVGGDWKEVEDVLGRRESTVIEKITNNGDTALHVAVGNSKQPEFLMKMLGMTPLNTQLSDLKNHDGSTLLHVAAIIGNTEAAEILLARSQDLLLAKDNDGQTPLALALSNMHNETARHLLQHINTEIQNDALFSGATGDGLLVSIISSKDFGFARDLLRRYRALHSDAVLMAIAQNFPPEPNVFEKGTDELVKKLIDFRINFWDEFGFGSLIWDGRSLPLWVSRFIITPFTRVTEIIWMLFGLISKLFVKILDILVSNILDRVRIHRDAMAVLWSVCFLIKFKQHSGSYHHCYTNPILEATRQNAYQVVGHIVDRFPNAILSANEDGHNIIQYAVINRSEKVYNLLYQMSEHRNIYRTIKDSYGNNLLHLAARLAPSSKLNLISGAALQIQRELQWFKEVKRFVCPLSIIQKNSSNETPQTVFTKEHEKLVIDGEKWMKSTAESFTITAALIITIVFAAAITVPGGSDQNTGIPIFTNSSAFRVFAISDAISLFAAVTSLLMFLSILTARFAEQDFLIKLPTKLIIGLATLFISTTAMIVAFAATLYLVFGQSNSRILVPIAVLTCLPITSFMTLQFPLVLDLMSATYGRSIFGKKIYKSFY